MKTTGEVRGEPIQFQRAPRCGAKNRQGKPCRAMAMRNGRCKFHGGKSTGPKTAEGRARIAKAATRHGRYTKQATAERRAIRLLLRDSQAMLADILDPKRYKDECDWSERPHRAWDTNL